MKEFTYYDQADEPPAFRQDFGCRQLIKAGRAIKDLPAESRPRERLLSRGAATLSDAELLAILLNTGIQGKNVSVLAEELLALLDHSKEVPSVKEISRLSGLGEAKSCAIAAMLEFGFRRWGSVGKRIRNPADIYSLVRHYADRKQERFISISLNGAHEVLAVRVVTIGLVNRTIVHPREVFAPAIEDLAASIIIGHNHPSGALDISRQDKEVTKVIRQAGELLGIRLDDHIIVAADADDYVSAY